MSEQDTSFVFPWDQNRPKMITFVSILIFLFSFLNLIKSGQVLSRWNALLILELSVSPVYLLLNGLVWSISGGFLSWSLWKGKPWTRSLGMIISLVYVLVFWIEAKLIAEPSSLSTRWPFNLVITLVALPAFWIILNHPRYQAFFNRNHA